MDVQIIQFLESAATEKDNRSVMLIAADYVRQMDEESFHKPLTKDMVLYTILWMVKNNKYPTCTFITRIRNAQPKEIFNPDVEMRIAIQKVSEDPPSKLKEFNAKVTKIFQQAKKRYNEAYPVVMEKYEQPQIRHEYLGSNIVANTWDAFMRQMVAKLKKMRDIYQVTEVA